MAQSTTTASWFAFSYNVADLSSAFSLRSRSVYSFARSSPARSLAAAFFCSSLSLSFQSLAISSSSSFVLADKSSNIAWNSSTS